MENFIVSARKYRPSTFASVVGQPSITNTLKNAIKSNHIAHAYLFCGPRGVGKTTCARIFAKTLNCMNLTTEYEACNECNSCKSFNDSRSFNIHELDAASNNSVEDIRSLIEQVRIPPQMGKYSIYIIDEVHMLSSAAFNAFLKTLEEPPVHAIFILATTEKHKIIPTILSRCQIFDFNRIRVEDTVKHLQYVAEKEIIEADIDGLNIIAQKADGAMRDALSFFDQIVSFAGKKFTYADVINNLNVLDYDYYFKLTDAFLNINIQDSLLIFNEILDNGFDGHHFITGLTQHFRDLLVCADVATQQLLEVGANIRDNYARQAQRSSPYFLFHAMQISNDCDLQYKNSRNPRLLVELALIRMCNILNALEQQTKQQERQEAPVKTQANTTVVNKQAETVDQRRVTNTNSIKGLMNSGSNLQNKQATPEVAQVVASQKNDARFTQEQMIAKWTEFANNVKAPRMKSILTTYKPELKGDSVIQYKFNNSVSESNFATEIANELSNFLRKELNNDKIAIETIIEQQAQSKRPFSEQEKAQFLSSKNPLFTQFCQQFNLER